MFWLMLLTRLVVPSEGSGPTASPESQVAARASGAGRRYGFKIADEGGGGGRKPPGREWWLIGRGGSQYEYIDPPPAVPDEMEEEIELEQKGYREFLEACELAADGNSEPVLEMWPRMIENGFHPLFIYNHLIVSCVGVSQWQRALEFYEEMMQKCITPDEITKRAVLEAFVECDHAQEAASILIDLTSEGLQASESVLKRAVKMCVTSGRTPEILTAVARWESNTTEELNYRDAVIHELREEITDNTTLQELSRIEEFEESSYSRPSAPFKQNNSKAFNAANEMKEKREQGLYEGGMQDNPKPSIYDAEAYSFEPEQLQITANGNSVKSIFDHIANITDPEHPVTLGQLRVVTPKLIDVTTDHKGIDRVSIQITPTVPHCSVVSLIGLAVCLRLRRRLDPRKVKVSIQLSKGSHDHEVEVNKQLQDKERVSAALENPALLERLEWTLAE